MYKYDNYRISGKTGPQCLYSHRSAGLASCSCTKALSHPEATVCQYQEVQCEQAGIPIVACVCLSWSSLSAESHTERGDSLISGICLSISASSDCLPASTSTQNINQPNQLLGTVIFLFISAIWMMSAQSTILSSVRFDCLPFNLCPWSQDIAKQRLREGGGFY